MITKLAVKYLTWKLRKDKDLWITYHSNMATSFLDAYNKAQRLSDEGVEPLDLHTVAMVAANNFMKLWILNGVKEVRNETI